MRCKGVVGPSFANHDDDDDDPMIDDRDLRAGLASQPRAVCCFILTASRDSARYLQRRVLNAGCAMAVSAVLRSALILNEFREWSIGGVEDASGGVRT
eukprot:1092981-Rhodomonas_salina.2